MKRDWDLIREILLRLEEKGHDVDSLSAHDFGQERAHETTYHVEILADAGLIDAPLAPSPSGPPDFIAIRLTWAGHEFLDAIRNDNVWTRTKQTFISKSIAMTFDLIKSVAAGIAVEILKRHVPA